MPADITVPNQVARARSPRLRAFGLSWRIIALVIVAVMTAEVLIFLPSIARFRLVYLQTLIESGTLAALALDATPDNMVTEGVKRSLLNNARVDTVVLVEPDKPKRALMTIEPSPAMPSYNLKEEGFLALIWDALTAMSRDGAQYMRVGGESLRLPKAMVWIIIDELPMRLQMYEYATRVLVLSIIVALFTAVLLYLGLRWLVIRPLQELSSAMTSFRKAPEEPDRARPPSRRNDEIGVVDREFQNLQQELRASLRQKSRLAEIGAATNKINHDLRNMLASAQLVSDQLSTVRDPRVQRFAPKLLRALERAIDFCQSTLSYGRAQEAAPVRKMIPLEPMVEEVRENLGLAGQNVGWIVSVERGLELDADHDQLFRVLLNLARNAVQALEGRAPNDPLRDQVRITGRREGGVVVIEVADTGPGFSPRAKEHLFEAFSGSTRPGGTGLGLAIAAELIRAHGGEIRLVEGTIGATFRLTIPDQAVDLDAWREERVSA